MHETPSGVWVRYLNLRGGGEQTEMACYKKSMNEVGTVRLAFHALSAKYFVLPAHNISRTKTIIGGARNCRNRGMGITIKNGGAIFVDSPSVLYSKQCLL